MLAKRVFDVVIIAVALPLWLPVFCGVAILVRVKLGSPILFRQKRPGKGGAIFELIKFRTMRNDRNLAGEVLPDQQRRTPLGKWLRSSSLDELPEVLNILRGEMSLVGPRPLLVHYLPHYSTEQARRHEVLPGITGWAQVNGRNSISWEEKFNYDVWYVDNISFVLDLKIIFETIKKIFILDEATITGVVPVQKFKGSPEIQR